MAPTGCELHDLVRRQTREPARFAGLHDRGVLAPGMKADINVIDFANLALERPEMVVDLPAGGTAPVAKGARLCGDDEGRADHLSQRGGHRGTAGRSGTQSTSGVSVGGQPEAQSARCSVPNLTNYTTYADAQRLFSTALLWELFDGDREHLNIGHECVDRHAVSGRVALRVAHADGPDEVIGFAELAAWSSRCAHWLAAEGVQRGDRVAIMLDPSLAFYAAMFGAVKRGAIAVPLFTLFGPDGVLLRTRDCAPRLLLTTPEKVAALGSLDGVRVIAADHAFMAALAQFPDRYEPQTASGDLAIFQYTSGTTREMPAAIRHTHRALVVLMNAALYGTGLRPGDRFFCPSSPAWGHGLWHGTLAPLALGIETGAYAGRFDAERLLQALQDYGTTNLSAAATHYRMMKNSGRVGDYRTTLRKLSFTGEPIDHDTLAFTQDAFGAKLCSMYGTTEVGVVLANYPGRGRFRGQGRLARPSGSGRGRRGATTGWLALPPRTSWARSRCGDTAPGSRPRIAAAWMTTDTSTMPAAPTTRSSPPAGP